MRLAFAAIALIASPAFAQVTSPAAAPVAAPATRLSVDTPIETIAADPAGKAVLDTNFPGLTTHQMYDSFKAMTLTEVQPMSGGRIKDEQVAKAKAELAAIK